MPSMSSSMPQLDGGLFLTDGGIETSLIFHDGLELPLFAAFVLFADEAGTAALRRYYRPYLALAREAATGFVFESPTGGRAAIGASASTIRRRRWPPSIAGRCSSARSCGGRRPGRGWCSAAASVRAATATDRRR